MTHKEIINALIANDEAVTRQFFYQNCRPQLYNLIADIFSKHADYDELVNEFYLHLMKDDARRLRSFNGDGSIYHWIMKEAYHFYLDLKFRRRVIEEESSDRH